jgi:RNA polymerase sigma-70 factor (ECF subfamily)
VGRFEGTGRAAAEELFTACYPRLTGWVRRLVDDDEAAHEIAAEAFARLLARWSRLDNPQSYLYVIAANLASDHWRKTGRERHAVKKLAAAPTGASACHPAQDVDVRALIEALPPRLRAAFLLHHYAGFGVREVAAMLGRPEGTIKADLHHARAAESRLGGYRGVIPRRGRRLARPVSSLAAADPPGRPASPPRHDPRGGPLAFTDSHGTWLPWRPATTP